MSKSSCDFLRVRPGLIDPKAAGRTSAFDFDLAIEFASPDNVTPLFGAPLLPAAPPPLASPGRECDGDDVHVELPLTPAQAALGGPFDVLTVDGVVELRVPAGAQSGARLALRGRGAPKLNGGGARGSHYVHVSVVTPSSTT